MPEIPVKPLRLLVVMPSWLGDCVMATPALRTLRTALPGCFIGGLVRPGNDALLAGLDCFDELHVERASGVMGPKFVAAKVRPRRYDTTLLLTNSFSTALTVRIAGIPRRIGFDRDSRGLLLTHRLKAPTRADGSWAPVAAVAYYLHAAHCLLDPNRNPALQAGATIPPVPMELAVTPEDQAKTEAIFSAAGITNDDRLAILNPGGNNPAKRWPIDRFAATAKHLHERRGMKVLLNGSPAEAELVAAIASKANCGCIQLPGLGITIGALKAIVQRCAIMVTNDTGPRHIAAALGVPVVSLFGPTDHRWTTIHAPGGEEVVLADPTLTATELANDHPERCAITKISEARVLEAIDRLLGTIE